MAERWQSRRAVGELQLHPLALSVPAMTEAEYAALKVDIARNGIEQPLDITADGEILDGRHRFRAALELGQKTAPVRVVAPADASAYILRVALKRRHLTPSQQAALAVELVTLEQPQDMVAMLPRTGRTRDLLACHAQACPRTVQDALTVFGRDRELFERIKAGQIPAHKARLQLQRRERYQTIGPAPPLPADRYELILADPPWQLGNPDSAYAPEQYYPTLPLDQIAELEIPAAENALLYLWAVNSHLREAWQVLDAWGFEQCSCEVWVKPSIGMGVWTRNRHELLLIGRKGNASPAPRQLLLDSVIEAPRGRHSQKPTLVYQRLEHLYPGRSKLELFARGIPRPGWTSWGNQLDETAA